MPVSTSTEEVNIGLGGCRYGLVQDSIHMPSSVRKLRIMDYERCVELVAMYPDSMETVDWMARLARTLNYGTGPQKERALQECGR